MLSRFAGGPEGGDLDRRVPDSGDVCWTAGGHRGGGQSGGGHRRGLEESGQRQPHCRTRVSRRITHPRL